MFNYQGSELIIILLLALVVLGPEKLPDAMRRMGKFYAELKKMSSSFQQEFRSAVDEPLKEVRETANLLRDSADFRSLQSGDREPKPRSAEMPTIPSPTSASGPVSVGGATEPFVPPSPTDPPDGSAPGPLAAEPADEPADEPAAEPADEPVDESRSGGPLAERTGAADEGSAA